MTTVQKLKGLKFREWCLLAQAQVLLPLTFFGVRVLGVIRWHKTLIKVANFGKTNGSPAQEGQMETPAVISRMVSVAANRGLYEANCLQQSLVLNCLLKRNGIASQIHFGARKENEQFEAHAWVEVNGKPISFDEGVHRTFSTVGIFAAPRIE